MDYVAVTAILAAYNVLPRRRRRLIGDIRVIESAAIAALTKQSENT